MPKEIGPNTIIPNSREAQSAPEQRPTALDQTTNDLSASGKSTEELKKNLHEVSTDPHQDLDPKLVPKLSNEPVSGFWKFLEKFLRDDWPVRKIFALGNETAESFKELMFNWLPQPIAWTIHKVLWAAAILATGGRVAANAKFAPKPEDRIKAGAKLLIHDGFAAIGLPTLWVNYVTNPIQNKIYKAIKLPEKVADIIRSAVSLFSCYFVIGRLDKPAKEASALVLNYRDDHHKQVNQ